MKSHSGKISDVSTSTTTIRGIGIIIINASYKKVKYPYNLGWYRNVCAVLGNQPLFWMWPQRMQGNGLYFPMRLQGEGEKRASTLMHEDTSEFATLVRKPSRLHTRASTSSNLRVPTTPASVLTFNTTSTLVDPLFTAKLPSSSTKETAIELPCR